MQKFIAIEIVSYSIHDVRIFYYEENGWNKLILKKNYVLK